LHINFTHYQKLSDTSSSDSANISDDSTHQQSPTSGKWK
jgi:hypothetical protein